MFRRLGCAGREAGSADGTLALPCPVGALWQQRRLWNVTRAHLGNLVTLQGCEPSRDVQFHFLSAAAAALAAGCGCIPRCCTFTAVL